MSVPLEPQSRSLAELAEILGAELVGDAEFCVGSVAHPLLAEGEDTLALAMDKGSYKVLSATKAGAVIVSPGSEVNLTRFKGGLVADRSRLALAHLLDLFPAPVVAPADIHVTAVIDPTATVGRNARIGAFVTVGPGSSIGDDVVILSHVSVGAGVIVGNESLLYSGVRLGDRSVLGQACILHHNVSIGADGFGFVTADEGSIETAIRTGEVTATNDEIIRINSIGNVVIGDNVEIGANSCVDRGTLGPTRIGSNTKIDNLVQIAHNVTIGESCLIAGSAGIAGSSKIGNRVVIGGGCCIREQLTIGDDAVVTGMAGVITNIPEKKVYAGYPARPLATAKDLEMDLMRVSRVIKEVRELSTRLKQLENSPKKRQV